MLTHWIFERMNVHTPGELALVALASLFFALASRWLCKRAAMPRPRRWNKPRSRLVDTL